MATRHLLDVLLTEYEKRDESRVDLVNAGGVDVAKRIRAGEPFDFVVLARDVIDEFAASGHVDGASRTDIARSSIAMAVRSGAPRPDISSEGGVREAVLAARTIGYSTGPSGTHLLRLLDRWGIAQDAAPRLVRASPGIPVASMIAAGDAELGFQQLSELAGAPGIDLIGLLPEPIQSATTFTAAVCTASGDPAATRRLLAWLASDATADAKRRFGLQPP